jgi:signal transduction histidine kinase
MASPNRSGGTWQRLRRVPGQTPLRLKLIAVVLALVTVALTVISIAGIFVLRGYLLHQADLEVGGLVGLQNRAQSERAVGQYLLTGQALSADGPYSIQWVPTGSHQTFQVASEVRGFRYGAPAELVPGPSVHPSDSWLSTTSLPSRPLTVSAVSGGGRWRVASFSTSIPSPTAPGEVIKGIIIVGIDVTSAYHTINELTVIDLLISCALLIVLAIVGVAVIRTSMRPLTDIERTADAIAAGDLGRRVPESDPRTEVGRLGRSLNIMLAQIEAAFRARTASEEASRRSEEAARQSALTASRSEHRMRQFVADASHELRTPLTAIRGYAEYYRQRGGVQNGSATGAGKADAHNAAAVAAGATPATAAADADDSPLSHSDLDRIIQRVEQEATRMGVLVDDMLLLARLDQERPLDFRTVDLLAIAADALHDARVIAPERTINLTVDTPDAPLVVGDEVGLRQVVGNLMSNAMTHTPDGTPIDITIRAGTLASGHGIPATGASQPGPDSASPDWSATEPSVILEVSDKGPGLTTEQKEHVFERFYRTDRARSRTAGGTGLGLAIVAALVSVHSGKVWVDSEPGSGATFGFALPMAPEARHLS